MKHALPLCLLSWAAASSSCGRDSPVLDSREAPAKLTLLTLSLPIGARGQEYTASLLADGPDRDAISWRVISGGVPGLELRETSGDRAVLTGTPSSAGGFSIEIQVSDSVLTLQQRYQVFISDRTVSLRIQSAMLPPAQLGEPYAAALVAEGGSGRTYDWSVIAGALPDGLSLSRGGQNAQIYGTPSALGSFSFTVRVTDDAGASDEAQFSITVDGALQIITSVLAEVPYDTDYETTIEARSGTPPYRWEADGLPDGFSLNRTGTPNTTLFGRSTERGIHPIYVRVFDQGGMVAERSFEIIVVDSGFTITTEALSPAAVGVPYDAIVDTAGGVFPLSWYVRDAPLGLVAIGEASWVHLTGIPRRAGVSYVEFEVTDQSSATARRTFTLNVVDTGGPLEILTTELADAERCGTYHQSVQATGGTGTGYRWTLHGDLPPGLSLIGGGTPSTAIVGAPRASGTFSSTITVTDDAGNSTFRDFRLTVSPNGGAAWTVIGGDLSNEGSRELYAVDLCGGVGAPYVISSLFGRSGGVSVERGATQQSPDRARVAFLGDFDDAGVTNLYIVELGAAAPGPRVALLPGIQPFTDVLDFAWSPDGSRLAFRANLDTSNNVELYLVDFRDPAQPRFEINGPLQPFGDVAAGYRWSPDGSRIAYRADERFDQDFELFVVDVGGTIPGASLRANTDLATGGQISERFVFSPGGGQLIFRGALDASGVDELYLVDVDPISTPIKLNDPLTVDGDVRFNDFAFAPDGRGLIYLADAYTDETDELFYVALGANGPDLPVRISDPLASGLDVRRAEWSPSAARVLYLADPQNPSVDELFLVDLDQPGAPIPERVTPSYTMATNAGFIPTGELGLGWSPDGRWIAFRDRLDGATRAWAIDASNATLGALSRIDGAPVFATNSVEAIDFSPDGDAIAIRGDLTTDGVDELYLRSATGPVRISAALVAGGDVSTGIGDVAFTDDGAVLYRADQDSNNVLEVYRVDPSAPGTAVKIHAPLTAALDALFFVVR